MRSLVTLFLCLGALCAYGGDSEFPWGDLKDLYRAQIAREMEAAGQKPSPEPVVVIEDARYQLHIAAEQVQGEVELTGRLISGTPVPVPLFGAELVLREGGEVVGATLLPPSDQGGIRLLPTVGAESFQVKASFLVQSVEEQGGRQLVLAIPTALRNRAKATLDDGLRLLEAPGIPGAEGEYYLATAGTLQLRYTTTKADREQQVPEVDLFTRVVVSQRRILLETQGVSARPLPEGTLFHLPVGAQLLNTSMKPSEITLREEGTYALSVEGNPPAPLIVACALTIPEDGGPVKFTLPSIDSNAGREGRFVVVEPDDGQVDVQGDNLVSNLPVAQLGSAFSVDGASTFMRIPTAQPVVLTVTRFKTEKVMDTVLESQSIHVTFDETGRSLSTLRLELPPNLGPRLALEPVPGSEIWSLLVNGVSRQVYTDAKGAWIVPLDVGQSSLVELAFLREGEPVGLHGALQVDVPHTGLGAKTLYLGIALPNRVALQSVEGPVNTTPASDSQRPPELADAPYVFTQPFYKGEGMRMSISYKEPVNSAK